jgi:pilus assembly protein TadC
MRLDWSEILPITIAILVFAGTYSIGGLFLSKHAVNNKLKKIASPREGSALAFKSTQKVYQFNLRYLLELFQKIVFWGPGKLFSFHAMNEKLAEHFKRAGIFNPSIITYPIAFVLLVTVPLVLIISTFVFIISENIIIALVVFVSSMVLSFFIAVAFLNYRHKERSIEFSLRLAETVNLILIGLNAGLSVEASIRRMIPEMHKISHVVAQEFSVLTAELQVTQVRSEAYENLTWRISCEALRHVVTVFIQSETQGSSASKSLRQIATVHDNDTLSEVEGALAKRSAYLSIPLLLFTLPTAFSIILIELIVEAFFE